MTSKKTFKSEFLDLINNSENILITSHISPDDDSISSVLSMLNYLKSKYPQKHIEIAYESKISPRWAVFSGFEKISSEVDFESILKNFDCLICLDANQYHRMTQNINNFKNFSGKKVCIDHHKSEPDFWDLSYIDTDCVANAQILYEIFYEKSDANLAKSLLLGILGDSGNLRFVSYKSAVVFDVVKRLVIDAEIDIQSFKSSYDYFSKEATEIMKFLILHQQIVSKNSWPTLNLTFLERNEANNFDPLEVKEGINLYIATFSLLVKEVTWSLTFYPVADGIKISGRSLPGSINVRKLFEELKIGSGHDRAAGAKFENLEEVSEAVNLIFKHMENNSPTFD